MWFSLYKLSFLPNPFVNFLAYQYWCAIGGANCAIGGAIGANLIILFTNGMNLNSNRITRIKYKKQTFCCIAAAEAAAAATAAAAAAAAKC